MDELEQVRWASPIFGELSAPVFSRLPSGAVIVNPHPITDEIFVVPKAWELESLSKKGAPNHGPLFK